MAPLLIYSVESTGEDGARESILSGTCDVLEFNQDDDEFELRVSYKDNDSLPMGGISGRLKDGF